MIIGHLAMVGIAKLTYFQRENLAFLALASFGPDIIDKPANILLGMPGRGISHSLIIFAIVCTLASIYCLKITNKPRLLCAAIILWGSHLAGDFLQWRVLLWPFAGSLERGSKFHVTEKLTSYYVEFQYPHQLWLEIICVAFLLGIILSRLSSGKFPFRISFQTSDRPSPTLPPS
jgi:membrane-bound metal-dependent hydrolase YbcI (DUF457 family)